MKTSNYIFSAFLIFILSNILLLFIGAKYFKDDEKDALIIGKRQALEDFSVVVAEPGAHFNLKTATENKIIQRYLKASVPNYALFTVRHDTLFVFAVKQQLSNKKSQAEGGSFITSPDVFCKNIKSIIARKNSSIYLDKFESDSLSVSADKVQLICNFKKIRSLSVKAKDSDIELKGVNLDTLFVKLDKTKLSVPVKNRILHLSGSLKNSSQANFRNSNTVDIDIDDTSIYDFYSKVIFYGMLN